MKNKMKLGMCSALLIGSLVGTGDLAAYASSDGIHNKVAQQVVSPFKDVLTDHYAYEAIEWGKSKGLINGYSDSKGNPNGMFGPNDNVTEAQFVKMVSVYLGLKDNNGNITKNKNNASHWSDTHYDAMAKHGVPLNGYFDNAIRNKPMKRGSVAQALAYLLGDSTNLKDSINYLLATGVTSGQNPQYEGKDLYKFFGSTNNLTRGQVITFLYRMDTKNINEIGTMADMTAGDSTSLNSKAKEGYSYVDVSLGAAKNANNTGGSTDNYGSFFGNGGNTGGNTGTGSTQEAKTMTLSEAQTRTSEILNSNAKKLLSNSKYKASEVTKNPTKDNYGIVYSYRPTSDTYTEILITVENGKVVSMNLTGYLDKVFLDIISSQFGIQRSLLTGTTKDSGKIYNNYKILHFGNSYGVLLVR